MPLNLDYSLQSEVAIEGMVANVMLTQTQGKTALTTLSAGKFVKLDPTGLKVGLLSDAADVSFGVTRWSTTMVTNDLGITQFNINRMVPVVTEGTIWVRCIAAVTDPNALVYGIISGANRGQAAVTSGATTTTAPVGRVDGMVTSAAGLVRVKIIPTL